MVYKNGSQRPCICPHTFNGFAVCVLYFGNEKWTPAFFVSMYHATDLLPNFPFKVITKRLLQFVFNRNVLGLGNSQLETIKAIRSIEGLPQQFDGMSLFVYSNIYLLIYLFAALDVH